MAAFTYEALSDQGKRKKGVIEADSPRAARQQLREQGLAPLSVSISNRSSNGNWLSTYFQARLSTKELGEMTRQLSTLINAGLPIDECLNVVIGSEENRNSAIILAGLRSQVVEGKSLAQSMAQFPRSFPPLYRSSVAAGEHSANLDKVLEKLADHLEQSHESKSKIQLALTYPIILLMIAVTMVSGLMIYVVPDVIEIFARSKQALPPLTQGLIKASDFIQAYGWTIPLAFILLAIAIVVALQQPKLKMRWHKTLLLAPMSRKVARAINASRYASTLSMLLGSGVSLTDSMTIAADTISNTFFRQSLDSAHEEVNSGKSLGSSLAQTKLFPPIMVYMVTSGESSGTLPEMLERTANQQQKNMDKIIGTSLAVLEPLMLLLMGGIVLLIVMAILLPILNINQLVG